MEMQKILRWLIYFFIGLIALSSLLIWVNDTVARLRPAEEEEERDVAEDEKLKGIYTIPPIKSNVTQGGLPEEKYEYSSEENPEGSTSFVVKIGKDFKAVGEKPQSPAKALAGLAAPKKAGVSLGKNALDKEIMPESSSGTVKLESSGVPEPGFPLEKSGITMISVPVDYKIFSSADVWKNFADAYRIKFDNNFAANDLVVLVSLSDFPPGIFSIKEVLSEKGGVKLVYSVNPLLMSAGIEEDLRTQYAVAKIPKGTKKITLVQGI
ncbi:MAG: hypothetical protein J5706_05505 [Elusimicrobiales bacterium]|nr:hypothetical protein [Elusimicrobiales bacterium]